MSTKKKALVFLDYDMLIRHFILSGVFNELEAEYDVKYVFHSDDNSSKQGLYTDLASLGLTNYTSFHVPRKRLGFWDHLYCAKVLNAQRGTDNYAARLTLMNLTRSPKWVRRYQFLSLPGIFDLFSLAFRTVMGAYQPLLKFLEDEAPDIIIHPSLLQGFFINELVPHSKNLGIPFVCLMNSWDNPSAKAVATGLPDKLVVWGEQTRRHAIDYMKMPAEDILMFGAAQFQVYRTPVEETDEQLRAMFKVPETLPIILYGGTSKGVLENNHLQLLENAIEAGRIPPCHILYRPHPWRGELALNERSFFDYEFKHVSIDPFMEDYYRRTISGAGKGFDMADYDITRKLMKLVHAVTSPLSTILLETIMHQKPIQILLFSDTADEMCKGVLDIATTIAHFADLKGPGISYCSDEADIESGCALLLEQANDPEIKKGLQETAAFFVVTNGPTYGERLRKLANQMTA